MPKVIFNETQHVRNVTRDVYEKGAVYDLSEASIQYWNNLGLHILRLLTDEEVAALDAKNDEKRTEQTGADEKKFSTPVAQVVPIGKNKVNVIGADGVKLNDKPLGVQEANHLISSLKTEADKGPEAKDTLSQ